MRKKRAAFGRGRGNSEWEWHGATVLPWVFFNGRERQRERGVSERESDRERRIDSW